MLQEFGFNHLMCDFGSTRHMPFEDMKPGHHVLRQGSHSCIPLTHHEEVGIGESKETRCTI